MRNQVNNFSVQRDVKRKAIEFDAKINAPINDVDLAMQIMNTDESKQKSLIGRQL